MSVIYAFIKLFDKKEYAEGFLKGTLFMNTLRSFKEYKDENGELRGDYFEGIVALYQPKKLGAVRFGNHIIPATELAAPIVIHDEELLKHNVFCMYSLNSRGHDTVSRETLSEFKRALEIHNSCFGLGSYCVVIRNTAEFISRCKSAIEKLQLGGTLGLVEYFDEHTFHGPLRKEDHGFQKRSLFKHQREYRIKIVTNEPNVGPYYMNVGQLSDIAYITTPDEFNATLEIRLPDGSSI